MTSLTISYSKQRSKQINTHLTQGTSFLAQVLAVSRRISKFGSLRYSLARWVINAVGQKI